MAHSVFGWDYPPGCSGPPEDEGPCECCGEFNLDKCICPECLECSTVGDPSCYEQHELRYTPEQLEGQRKLKQYYEDMIEQDRKAFEAEREAGYYD